MTFNTNITITGKIIAFSDIHGDINSLIIILRDCGNETTGDLKGDIKIGIKIQNTTQFVRIDMDLLLVDECAAADVELVPRVNVKL